jgi:hypothetical protein
LFTLLPPKARNTIDNTHRNPSSTDKGESTAIDLESTTTVHILNKDDKLVVKRAVPSPSNNIITVAVARLYVNYPNKHKWNFTGISGAVVLAEDLVGHTFFFKIVDVTVRVTCF